jgi:hypothetical protein
MTSFSEHERYLFEELIIKKLSTSSNFINIDDIEIDLKEKFKDKQHLLNDIYLKITIILLSMKNNYSYIQMHEANGTIETKISDYPPEEKEYFDEEEIFDSALLEKKRDMSKENQQKLNKLIKNMYEYIIDNQLYRFLSLKDLKGNNVFHILFLNNDIERILKIINYDSYLFLYKNNDQKTPLQLTTDADILKLVVTRNSELLVQLRWSNDELVTYVNNFNHFFNLVMLLNFGLYAVFLYLYYNKGT